MPVSAVSCFKGSVFLYSQEWVTWGFASSVQNTPQVAILGTKVDVDVFLYRTWKRSTWRFPYIIFFGPPFPKIVQVITCYLNSEHPEQQFFSQMQVAQLKNFKKKRKHFTLSQRLDALLAENLALHCNCLKVSKTERQNLKFPRRCYKQPSGGDFSELQPKYQKLGFLMSIYAPNSYLQLSLGGDPLIQRRIVDNISLSLLMFRIMIIT